MTRRFKAFFTIAAILLLPSLASAQASQQASPVLAGWQDGFFTQSPDGNNRLLIGITAQTDGRFSLDDTKPIINTFTIRKLRPTLSGRIARYFDFKVMPDFGNGNAVVQDAYFDVRFSPAFRVRTGQDKTPVGYELLIGDAYLLFPERSLASSLVPNRDIGVQVQGDVAGGKLFYAGGVFNGIPDGTSTTTSLDTNSAKALAGRIVVQPFRSSRTPAGPVNGLGFQVGGSNGKQVGGLPSFKTSVGQTYFSYASTAAASGVRNRVTPAVFYYYKSFGAFGEYVRSTQSVTRSNLQTDVANEGWDLTASFVVTGEAASDRGVRPSSNFDPANGDWGALQVLARYSSLTVDRAVFTNTLAAAGASGIAKAFTIGANWYPAPFIKYYFTYERTTFDNNASGARPIENVILFRTQLAF
jgi:phosphate-selective porin OprO/OprP